MQFPIPATSYSCNGKIVLRSARLDFSQGKLNCANNIIPYISALLEISFRMKEVGNQQQSNASAARVFELPGEPAIVINGVPEIIPSGSTIPLHCASSTVISQGNTNFGEWLQGREVLKLFGGHYYSGTVVEFDKESGWYRVFYEDGDSEDLDWKELEEVLLPLDATVPLKTLAQKIVRRTKKHMHKSVKNVAPSHKPQFKSKSIKGKKTSLA